MKHRAITLATLALIAILLTVSPVLAYVYRATYTVTSENTTDFEMLGVVTDNAVANQWMADNGFFNSTANDTRIETLGGLEKPHMVTDNATFTAIPVPANSQTNLYFTTGNSELDSLYVITGYNGYVTAEDEPTIELGDNFTVEHSGWVTVPGVTADRNLLDFVRANSDWVSIPDHADFSFVTGGVDEPFSIVVWVNLDDATSSRLVTKLTAAKFEWTFYTTGGDLVSFLLLNPDGTAQIGRTTGAVTAYEGEWVHLVGTYDGTELVGGINVYINGQDADTTNVIVGAYAGMTDDTAVVELGSRLAGGSEYLDGILAEVKIYSVELTPSEVTADYSGVYKSTDLVAWYELDDGAGNPADSSGNSHDATANTADWITGTAPRTLGILVDKPGAFKTTIDSDGDLTTTITGIASTTAPDISSGEQIPKTIADSTFFYIEHSTLTWDNYAPPRTDLIFNTPLWHSESDGSPFTSKDVNEESCTVTGATWSADGYVFDGANDFIACGNGTQLSFGDGTNDEPFTFHIWANVTNIAANRGLLQKDDSGNTKREYGFHYLAGGTYRLALIDESTNKQASRAANVDPATTGEMTLYSATYDGGGGATAADGITLYINGATIASTASNDALYVAMEPFADVPLYIGNRVDLDLDLLGLVGEAAIYDIEQTPAEVLAYFNAVKWQYDGSTEYFYYQLISSGVPNTAHNWRFLDNNVMPYADYITISVNGTQELWFEPTAMIIGTNLPDRESAVSNNGTFIFGTNPTGVSVAMGGLVSEAQPSPGVTADDPSPDIMPGVEVTDWYIEPDVGVGGSLLTNPMRPFVTMMSDTTTLTELQAWRLLGTALVLMVLVGTIRAVRGHLGIASIATAAIILGMVVWTIYPMWTLVLAAVMFIAGLIAERSPSL